MFPGGYVDRGEEITLAALREAREEAGLDVRLDHLINIYSYAGRAPVIIVYAATMISGELAVDDEGSRRASSISTTFRGTTSRSAARAKRCATTSMATDRAGQMDIHGLHGLITGRQTRADHDGPSGRCEDE